MGSKHEEGNSRAVTPNTESTPTRENGQVLSVEYSGPLPPANELVRYNEAHPHAADRIITMAEEQAAHRRSLEKNMVRSGNTKSFLGLIFGFLLSSGTIVMGGFLIYSNKSLAGLAVIIVALASLVGAFLYSKKQGQQELQEKREGDES